MIIAVGSFYMYISNQVTSRANWEQTYMYSNYSNVRLMLIILMHMSGCLYPYSSIIPLSFHTSKL